MVECPFLSTPEEKIQCYLNCPLNETSTKEKCPFLNTKQSNRLSLRDIFNVQEYTSSYNDDFENVFDESL